MKISIYKQLCLVTLAISMNSAIAAEEIMLKNLTVTGSGEETIAVNLANPTLAIEFNAPTAQAAQKEVAKISTTVISFLRGQKVDKLKTNNINLYPRYEYSENNQQKLIGYTANNSITFQVANIKAGALLDESVKLGATRIDGISFSATNEEVNIAKNKAIAKASIDAKQKGLAAMQALGLTAKEIISVKVDGAQSAPPVVMSRAVLREASFKSNDSSSPVIGGETNIEAQVTLQISY